jgi:stage II sporulation protein D
MLTMKRTYHRRHVLLAMLAAGMALPCASAAGAAAATGPAATGPELVIDGAGDGHGVGMSQYGALGYAQHGVGYREILAHYYTGTQMGQVSPETQVRVLVGNTVQAVPLETYVEGVVAAEIPSGWPMAALEAQAVASRTYAITAHAGGASFDVYSDTRSQMYLGVAAQTPQTNAAVAATAGQVVTFDGNPAITYFAASSGGRTEDVQDAFQGAAPEPWLRGVSDPYDQGPLHRWRMTMTFATAQASLRGLVQGSFQGIDVLKRGASPRILLAYVLGSQGRTLVSGPELAARLGMYASTLPEPDSSGHPAGKAPTVAKTRAVATTPPTKQVGGTAAPARGESATGGTGAA